MNFLPTLTGHIKARACNGSVEEKGGARGFREEEERKEKKKEWMRWRKTEEEEVEGRWTRTPWSGGAASTKGPHSWEEE